MDMEFVEIDGFTMNEEMIKVIHRANLMKVGFNPVIKRIQSLKEWLETSALIE